MGGERIEGGLSLFGAQVTPVPTPVTAPGESSPQNNSPVIIAPNEPPPFDFSANLRRFALQQQFQPLSQQITPQPHPTPPALVVWSGAGAGSDVNGLRAGDAVAVRINPNDTQADVLRRAYTAYAERAGLSSSATSRFVEQMMRGGERIQHAGADRLFTDEEFAARREAGTINMIVSEGQVAELRRLKIEDLLSYGVFDWAVTESDERQVVELLRSDPNVSQTVRSLNDSNYLGALLDRVDNTEQRRELITLLGSRVDAETARLVEPHIEALDVRQRLVSGGGGAIGEQTEVSQNLWQVRFNLARMGVTQSTTNFDRAAYRDLIGNESAPFTGVGATGFNPRDVSVPFADQAKLFVESFIEERQATERLYKNPLFEVGMMNYLNSLSPADRSRQAELLLGVPVNSTMPEIFGGAYPSRAEVIQVAARLNNLEPELVAAFILAEQRDQSRREDGADYTAAINAGHNSSIGLGQVTISTARRRDLFSDLMTEGTRKQLEHADVARLLADDTINIFATARFIRQVADEGARVPASSVPRTIQEYRGLDMSIYSRHSSQWSAANIAALGSEYTSRQWDDVLEAEWGHYVYEAYTDVKASGVFR